ncbi:RNA polymerase sigma-70 factor (ECF subfamily) [Stackebrandtia albiflava]|uniref:RNA polymerase sigma-70 factor (ECF subfamily) n=1 Tax=Stackebrandtia albiflava TaxID=406432 RepID=A0A562UQ69_9ACTN|nr:sigma-70 family RNA polymerase sigma factor [Stackebrandtia albiflava]TWJ07763.1 RNA polymerase sigma-70 factor (ECF subfamily) [Stackebrandtia albiflava]
MRARLRAGDYDAFEELFNEHLRSVYHHAYRLTGNRATAEDVASVTFLEAWRLRERLDADDDAGPPRAWLLGIATNVARNVRRSARRYGDVLARLPKPEVAPDHSEEVVARIDDRERLAASLAALKRLRRPEREVLTLYVWSELDYAQIAEALGIPVGTVRSRLSRARRKLARIVTDRAATPSERNRELEPRPGQLKSDRATAVRPAQEIAR